MLTTLTKYVFHSASVMYVAFIPINEHPYILLQATELDIIHGQAVEASENVKEGNEQVRGVSVECLIHPITTLPCTRYKTCLNCSPTYFVVFYTGHQEQSQFQTVDLVCVDSIFFLTAVPRLVQLSYMYMYILVLSVLFHICIVIVHVYM